MDKNNAKDKSKMEGRVPKMRAGFFQFTLGVIRWGGLALMMLLSLVALIFRTQVLVGSETWLSEYVTVRMLSPLNYLVMIAVGLGLFGSRQWLSQQSEKKLFWGLTIIFTLTGLILVGTTTFRLRDDAAAVFLGAMETNHGQYQLLEKGAYFDRFPHQLGLLTLERLLMKLYFFPNTITLFLCNLAAILGIHWANWQISDRLFRQPLVSRYTIVLSFLFLPFLFNVLFLYGLTFGLFFGIFGIYYLIVYLQQNQLRHGLVAALLVALANLVRNNYIILVVTVIGILGLTLIRSFSKKTLVVLLMTVGLTVGLTKVNHLYYERLVGRELSGMPKITWLSMGIQEENPTARPPGWYTGYVTEIAKAMHEDYELVEKDASRRFRESLKTYSNEPMRFGRLLGVKWLTTWTESSFESIWSGPAHVVKQPLIVKEMSTLYRGGLLYKAMYVLIHAVLLTIYLGSALFLVFFKPTKPQAYVQLYPFIYLAGGMLFHLFWETKSQYVSPYVYLLIPMAVYGWYRFGQWLKKRQNSY